MNYALVIFPSAQRELGAVPAEVSHRLRGAIVELAQEPRPSGCRKLTGREGWRLRVGDYRVLYDIDDNRKAVTIGHRRDMYR